MSENLKCHICLLLDIDNDAAIIKKVGEQLLPLCEGCMRIVEDLQKTEEEDLWTLGKTTEE